MAKATKSEAETERKQRELVACSDLAGSLKLTAHTVVLAIQGLAAEAEHTEIEPRDLRAIEATARTLVKGLTAIQQGRAAAAERLYQGA
jgi:hypothetical protein